MSMLPVLLLLLLLHSTCNASLSHRGSTSSVHSDATIVVPTHDLSRKITTTHPTPMTWDVYGVIPTLESVVEYGANAKNTSQQVAIKHTIATELDTEIHLDHPRIVKLLGWSRIKHFPMDRAVLVHEWAPHGTLYDLIRDTPEKFDRVQAKILLRDILDAMLYLEEDANVDYGDWRDENVFIFSSPDRPNMYRAKISDFDKSKLGMDHHAYLMDSRLLAKLIEVVMWHTRDLSRQDQEELSELIRVLSDMNNGNRWTARQASESPWFS